ncbi:hypothetical protein CKAH01_12473 [Colletotrichum kahawae]|uniref:Uncharacterized protein n=1 Tax=Colletotrichum kahawae TaxID=34407 RepID=A0AAD9YTC4_COLKA|nr:hypothetical protein CKAH01_12473 [Colletotrichum kahawae]
MKCFSFTIGLQQSGSDGPQAMIRTFSSPMSAYRDLSSPLREAVPLKPDKSKISLEASALQCMVNLSYCPSEHEMKFKPPNCDPNGIFRYLDIPPPEDQVSGDGRPPAVVVSRADLKA